MQPWKNESIVKKKTPMNFPTNKFFEFLRRWIAWNNSILCLKIVTRVIRPCLSAGSGLLSDVFPAIHTVYDSLLIKNSQAILFLCRYWHIVAVRISQCRFYLNCILYLLLHSWPRLMSNFFQMAKIVPELWFHVQKLEQACEVIEVSLA